MTPFPTIERWRFPASVRDSTLDAVLPAGRRRHESGVFWLGRRSAVSEIAAVVVPFGPGVTESRGEWAVAPEVYAAISQWAQPRRLTLLGVAHTHITALPPRLSRTDRQQGIKVPGVLAVVIPRGGDAPSIEDWGWFVYDDAGYRDLGPVERERRLVVTDDDVTVVRINANGVQQ